MRAGVPALPQDALVAQRFKIEVKGTTIATFQEVSGSGEEMISMQPVAMATMVSLPSAFITWRTARASAHPWQAR